MKKLLLVQLLLMSSVLFAQSAFTGTWKFNPQSAQFSGKATTFLLQNGMFRCDDCVPKIDIKADGEEHPRLGSPYSDAASVRVVDDHTVEVVTKKKGNVVSTAKDTVSPDGKTLTSEWTFTSENGQPAHGKDIFTRKAAGPAGAHAISGAWLQSKEEDASESVLTVTFQASEDGLTMSDGTGDSYTAKFDGKDYPYKGDPGTTSVSLKKISSNTIEETDKRNGKVISISHMTVSSDGQTLSVDNHDVLRGQKSKFEGKKQ